MDAVARAQIVWAETKDLHVPTGGDRGTLSALRQQVAAIASEADSAFSRFEPLPARDDELFANEVADCAVAVEAPISDALKNRRVIVWPSADAKTLNTDEAKPPAPWDIRANDTHLIGRFNVVGREVSAFSRPVLAGEDAPRFVSLVTGTGLPPGIVVYVPRVASRTAVNPRATRAAFWLAIVMLALFAIACVWSLSVGSATHSAQQRFVASLPNATSCGTSVDPSDPATLYGPPREWLLAPAGPGQCLGLWRQATAAALDTSNRDWWSGVKMWLASFTVSDTGAFSLRMPTLVMMASLIMLAVAAGLGVVGRALGLFIDQRNRMSLTRIQFAVWLVILIGGLASYALFNVGFWGEELSRIGGGLAYLSDSAKADQRLAGWVNKLSSLREFLPSMDTALWMLIGITGGTTVVSSFLKSDSGIIGSPTEVVVPQRRVRNLVNASPKDAALSDLVYGETEEDEGVVDATRVQTLAITGVLAAIYVNLVLESAEGIGGLTATESVTAGKQVFATMPPISATFLWLLGLSHATLIGGKLFGGYKSPARSARR